MVSVAQKTRWRNNGLVIFPSTYILYLGPRPNICGLILQVKFFEGVT